MPDILKVNDVVTHDLFAKRDISWFRKIFGNIVYDIAAGIADQTAVRTPVVALVTDLTATRAEVVKLVTDATAIRAEVVKLVTDLTAVRLEVVDLVTDVANQIADFNTLRTKLNNDGGVTDADYAAATAAVATNPAAITAANPAAITAANPGAVTAVAPAASTLTTSTQTLINPTS